MLNIKFLRVKKQSKQIKQNKEMDKVMWKNENINQKLTLSSFSVCHILLGMGSNIFCIFSETPLEKNNFSM